MSNEEDKIVTPDQSSDPKKSTSILFKGLGFIIIVGLLAALSYVGYDQLSSIITQSSADSEQKIQQLHASISTLQNATDTQQKTLQSLTDDYSQLKQTLQTLQQTQPNAKDQVLVGETRYLVQLADFNLRFRNNINQALDALRLADQTIQHANNAQYDNVRKAFAEDIADLESVRQVDTTGIYLRLLAMNNKMDELPLMNKPSVATEQSPESAAAQDLSWWQKGLRQTWESLRHIVVVRYNQTGKVPLIPPDQQAYLYQNLHAVTLHAMSALLQGETEIYRSSLQQAEAWIKDYCLMDSSVTTAMLSQLDSLKAVDIHPAIPSIARSLQAVEGLTQS